jgi:hypothetical protein
MMTTPNVKGMGSLISKRDDEDELCSRLIMRGVVIASKAQDDLSLGLLLLRSLSC